MKKTLTPILLGLAIIGFPLAYILCDNWLTIIVIWIIDLAAIIMCGFHYASLLAIYWNRINQQNYITYSLTTIIFSIGLAVAAFLFPELISFDWCGMLLVIWGIAGIVITSILAGILFLIICLIHAIKKRSQ